MPRVTVLCDASGARHARACARALSDAGFTSTLLERERYPTGDSLPALLHGVAARCDAAVAVVSASGTAQSWLSRELALQSLYPTWLLAIDPAAPVPACLVSVLGQRAHVDVDGVVRSVARVLRGAGP
jgi:hypothetical protein